MKWIKTFEEHIPKGHISYPDILNDNGFLNNEAFDKFNNFNNINKYLGFFLKQPKKIEDTIKFETYINLYNNVNINTIFTKTFEYYTDKKILNVKPMYNDSYLNDCSFTFNFNSDSISFKTDNKSFDIDINIICDKNTKDNFLILINQKFYNFLKEKTTNNFYFGYKSLFDKNEAIEIPFIRETLIKCISYSVDLTKEIIAKIFLNEIRNCKDAGPIIESMKETEWYEIFLKTDNELMNSLKDSTEMGLYD